MVWLSECDFERSFASMLNGFQHTAFRFEVRERYNVSLEQEPLRRFLAGEPHDPAWLAGWLSVVGAATAAGKRFMRVRAVSAPFSDYTRFGLAVSASHAAVGEDIRYLDRRRYEELRLPGRDTWLFDSSRLAVLHFDHEDRMRAGEIITDPRVVLRHCQLRDVAWHYAEPREQFISRYGHAVDAVKRG